MSLQIQNSKFKSQKYAGLWERKGEGKRTALYFNGISVGKMYYFLWNFVEVVSNQ